MSQEKKSTNVDQVNDISRNIIIPFALNGQTDNNTCDLNKIFQVNLTYNVDLLKNLLEGIFKLQKETDMKIKRLESQFPGLPEIKDSNINLISSNNILTKDFNIETKNQGIKESSNKASGVIKFAPEPILEEDSVNKDDFSKIAVRKKNIFIIYLL